MSGWRHFNDGDTLYGADIMGYFMSQAIPRFATTTARDAALTGVDAPVAGQMCAVGGTLMIYGGSAWNTFGSTGNLLVGGKTWKGSGALASGLTSLAYGNMGTGAVSLTAGHTYFVDAEIAYTSTGNAPVLQIKCDTDAIEVAYWFAGVSVSSATYRQYLAGIYPCTSTGSKTFGVYAGVGQFSGSVSVIRNDAAYIAVYDIGASSGLVAG